MPAGHAPCAPAPPPADDLPQATVTPLVPENAGSPRSSRRCRSRVPPHLAPVWRVPGARAHARSSPPSRGLPAVGGSCSSGRTPPPVAPPPYSLLLNLPLGRSRANCAPLGPLHLLLAMVAWRSVFLVCLAFSLATLVQRGKASEGWCMGTPPHRSPQDGGSAPQRPCSAHERPCARPLGLWLT